ncbi:asparaginase [Kribbella sp. NPDC050241]|uniref:asparaginase n=1 Tax=Kribbella sp. NPDC050241 TaxID=3364115 RepID=UPI003787A2E5
MNDATDERWVHAIALGGTIAMTEVAGGGVAPTLGAAELTGALPVGLTGVRLDASTFREMPGAHLELADLVLLRDRIDELFAAGVDGVVITQGTDTIEETAFALELLSDAEQPIVVTGAMRHPGRPGADGPANLLAAIQVAGAEESRAVGVLVLMDEVVHAARFVRKAHTFRPSAFVSTGVGPIGWVTEERVRVPVRPASRLHLDVAATDPVPPVALLTAVVGDDGRFATAVAELGYAGAVMAGFGAGHVSLRQAEYLGDLAKEMPVVLASRTGAGETARATYGFPGSERDLLGRGLIGAGSLDPFKARVLLSYALALGWPVDRIAAAFERLSR